jgi:indole-3-glycerol phosphate synthase
VEFGRAAPLGASVIGVDNSNLAVFRADQALTERLIARFTAADAAHARRAGAHAVLVGEALMRSSEPAKLVAAFRAG